MKNFLLFLFATGMVFSAIAQNGPVDFETPGNGADWTWTVFENDTDPALEIIANPDATGINTSATVAKFTALQTGQPFAGCETQHGADIGTFSLNATTSTISIMVWKSVISDVGIKLVEPSSAALLEIKVPNTKTDEWELITFDFSSREGIEYDQLVIFPDFNARASDNVVYFDNISFGGLPPLDAPMVAAPDPTIDPANVISLFSNTYTDVTVDTWETPWSSASLSDIQIMSNDTKKYEALDFVGIETVGANLVDASAMEYFHIDVWTPNMTTFRVKLVDFGTDGEFEGGDDSQHEIEFDNQVQNSWVSYEIPLSDFSGLGSTSHLAQLILSGLPVGAGVVYVDNVYFSNTPTSASELEANSVELFPNPAQSSISIRSNQIVEGLKIYNIRGELLMDEQALGNIETLNIAHLAKGMYIINATVNGAVVVERFIKN